MIIIIGGKNYIIILLKKFKRKLIKNLKKNKKFKKNLEKLLMFQNNQEKVV